MLVVLSASAVLTLLTARLALVFDFGVNFLISSIIALLRASKVFLIRYITAVVSQVPHFFFPTRFEFFNFLIFFFDFFLLLFCLVDALRSVTV